MESCSRTRGNDLDRLGDPQSSKGDFAAEWSFSSTRSENLI